MFASKAELSAKLSEEQARAQAAEAQLIPRGIATTLLQMSGIGSDIDTNKTNWLRFTIISVPPPDGPVAQNTTVDVSIPTQPQDIGAQPAGNYATDASLQAEASYRSQADAQLLPRALAPQLLTDAATYGNATTILLALQALDPVTGALTTAYTPLPVADSETAGVCPPTLYAQALQTAQDVEALKGRRLYYPSHLGTDAPSQEQLSAIVENDGGELLDGITVTDLDYGKDYTYYAATSAWVDRGSSALAIATNTSIGGTMGSTAPGYVAVDANGQMPLNGWDATQEAISQLQSGVAGKQAAAWANPGDVLDGCTSMTALLARLNSIFAGTTQITGINVS
jgi:hypothetical protein